MNRARIAAEIAELKAMLELPAGTTCYLADIHGQGNKFFHIINNKAGSVRRKLAEVLPDLADAETLELLKLCYYPEEYLARRKPAPERIRFFLVSLAALVSHVGSKLTRRDFDASVAAAVHPAIVSELVTDSNQDKIGSRTGRYQTTLIDTLLELRIAPHVILDLTGILRRHLVFRYIINGDLPDRGRDTAAILDYLADNPELRINWGNHDLLWMGAAAGSRELVAEVVRIQLRYGFSAVLAEDYGIDLSPLAAFATKTYRQEPAPGFFPSRGVSDPRYDAPTLARMQKAVAVMLWKLEAERHTELMTTPWLSRLTRDDAGTLSVTCGSARHELLDQDFPTLSLENPGQLSGEESAVLEGLVHGFRASGRLQRQMRHLAAAGSLFTIQDGILSFHAIIPVDPAGELQPVTILGKEYRGRSLFETLTGIYRAAFAMQEPPQAFLDLFYQGWKGENSWTFGKQAMQTFPRALIADKTTHKEEKAAYYRLLEEPEAAARMARTILSDFTCAEAGEFPERIFNGHIPVKLETRENPVKAGGLVICGDGGFAEAYGDAGFVLVVTSRGLYLNRLGSGISVDDVLDGDADILSETIWQEAHPARRRLKDCSIARELQDRIMRLSNLL